MRASRIASLLAALAIVAASWTLGQADVTVNRVTTMDGMGGLLKSSTTSSESYSGDMMVNDSETKMENKMMKLFGGGKPVKTTTITRLDKELIWTLNHKDKKYSEMTFAEMRALMDSLGQMMSGSTNPMAQQEPAIDTSEITFSEPKFEIKRTGKKETIAGYECDQAIMTMITEGTNRKTGEKLTLDVMVDVMLAQNVTGAQQIVDFGVRTATAMGMAMDKGQAQSMAKMLEMYGVDAEKLAEESKKLDGFAMKTAMSFSMGGDKMDQANADSEKAKADEQKKEEEEQAKKDDEAPADASSAAAKALGGLFGKKDKKKDAEAAKEDEAAANPAPAGAMFWMVSTVTGIESGAVPALRFEIPDGYKLEKSPLQKN